MSNQEKINMNVVFVTIPRSFVSPYAVTQQNCINAIKKYNQNSEIILYSDDEGIDDYARKYGYITPKIVKKNGHLPLVNEAIAFAAKKFPNHKICIINSDILVLGFLKNILEFIERNKLFEYMLVCRRTEVIVNSLLTNDQFNDVIKNYKKDNSRGRHTAIDFFLFESSMVKKINMPDFPVGRPGWDNWLASRVLRLDIPLIDISDVTVIAHQDHVQLHNYSSWNNIWSILSKHGIFNFSSLLDCNYKIIKEKGILKLKSNLLGIIIGTKIGRITRAYLRIFLLFLRNVRHP